MATISEHLRKLTTFFLAVFLWSHAVFFLNVQSTLVAKCTQLLRLTTSEVVLIGLLIIFSFAAGSGFWKPFLSVIYIYFFPFVLLGYAFYAVFRILRAINRWISRQASVQSGGAIIVQQEELPPVSITSETGGRTDAPCSGTAQTVAFLSRPFRRFTFLWCILLLVTTHPLIVWLSFIVVLFHLLQDIFIILEILFFSEPWLQKLWARVLTTIDTAIATISLVTPDTSPTKELQNSWNNLNVWMKIAHFLKNESYRVSRWVWVAGTFLCGAVYTYIAFLFSFAYFGIGRLNHLNYSWAEAFVTSIFIPFFVADLPKIFWFRLLGGLHCLLVLVVGIGTLVNFIQRRLRSLHIAAIDISNRLADEKIRENFSILEAKLANTPKATVHNRTTIIVARTTKANWNVHQSSRMARIMPG